MENSITLQERLYGFVTAWRNFPNDIKLTGVPRKLFLRSEWDTSERSFVTGAYLMYRALFLSYFLIFLIISLCSTDAVGYWPIMDTTWNFVAQTIYAALSFFNVAAFWWAEKFSKDHPFYFRNVNPFESIIWLFMNLSYSVPQFISITFWLFVYDGSDPAQSTPVGWSLTVHGINAMLAVLDVVIVATPVRPTHAVYPVLMQGIYVLFTYIYEVAGGKYRDPELPYIYSILNWREAPLFAMLTLVAGSCAVEAFHFLFWFLATLRIHYGAKYRSRRRHLQISSGNVPTVFSEGSPLLGETSA